MTIETIHRTVLLIGLQYMSLVAAADPAAREQLLAYDSAQERFEQGGGYEMGTAIDQVAEELRLDRNLDGRRSGSLSGGEQWNKDNAGQLKWF